MNDTPLDLDALANALLDDEATVDERAQVDADPELRRAVDVRLERLRAVRALLGDVEPASISAREAHLSTALSAWDRIPDAERTGALRDITPRDVDAAAVAAAASVSSSARSRDRGKQRSTRWLTTAAAVIAVVAVGGIVLRFAGDAGRDMDDAGGGGADSASEAPAETLTAAGELRTEAARAEAGDGGSDSQGDATADAADDAATFALDGTISTGIDVAAPPSDEGLVLLESAQDLADFAAAALEAPGPDSGPAATSADADDAATLMTVPDCDAFDTVVGPAVYRDTLVLVGIDEGRRLAIAARYEDCVTIATARM